MSAPEVDGGNGPRQTNSSSVETDSSKTNATRSVEIASRLSLLEELCRVLDINHSLRLKELGIKHGQVVTSESNLWLTEAIITLTKIRESRFTEIRCDSKKVIELWKTSYRAPSKGIDLHQLYAVADADSAEDIKSEKFLSATWLGQVKLEIERFESAAATKLKDKYMSRKKKLKDLLKLSHISPHDIGFDLNAPVVAKMYEDESKTKTIKGKIRELKPVVLKRKELVFRVEQVRAAINGGQSKSSIDALLGKAMEAFVDLPSFSNEKWLKYDGLETPILLGNLWSIACSMHEGFADDLQKNAEAALERTKARTRSGAGKRGSAQVRQQGSTCNTEKVSNNGAGNSQGDWTDKDTKWISHFAFNVTNIQRTSKCYSDCFGMKVLRECQQNDKDHMFLGFEKDKTTLHLMYKDGTRELQIGKGFGHVTLTNDDVRKVAKTIESSTFCTLLNKPCRVEGCSTVIAFASDPNEIMFEIIQSSSKFESICHLVLYVYDIDRSTRFYEKGLGMRILKTKNENMYKMVWLSFGDEDRATVLEFRSSIDGNHCDMGDVYYQMVIETVNVQESYGILKKVSEEEGAKILEEPTADRKVCSFLDPDGWRVVLIEHTDPDKVRHIL